MICISFLVQAILPTRCWLIQENNRRVPDETYAEVQLPLHPAGEGGGLLLLLLTEHDLVSNHVSLAQGGLPVQTLEL